MNIFWTTLEFFQTKLHEGAFDYGGVGRNDGGAGGHYVNVERKSPMGRLWSFCVCLWKHWNVEFLALRHTIFFLHKI